MGSKKTNAELIAEMGAMRHRLEALEKKKGNERRSNYLLRIFIDALPNFGFSFDAEIRILKVLTGSQISEAHALEGRFLAEVLPHEDAEHLENALRKTFETGEAQHFDFIMSILTGRRWYRVKSSLVANQDRDEKIAVLLFQDVTNEKLAEGVLKYAQLELAQQAEELRQSQKMEALGTLAGGIAHDFNNILAPILGYSELLLGNAKFPSEEHAYLSTIFKNAERAKDLVSQILLFSRRGQTEKKVSDLRPIVRDVLWFARSTLPKTVFIKDEISAASTPVICDPSQMHQVLVNLCVNAGQAIPDIGEIKVTLENVELESVECVDGVKLSGRLVRFAITDNGMGMDPETLSHIFEPFFTTKAVGKGTGLGLSTVFGIIRDHDGGISVSSEPGKGTTFEILLPAAKDKIEEHADNLGHVQYQGSENILFVDDEEDIAALGKIVLEHQGYTVTTASDGQEALAILAASPDRFSLVVTDQTMPYMTGETLAHELRILRPDIPIILCTGHSETVTPESSKAAGISSYLYKPIAPNELERVVRKVLDQAK